VTALTSRAFDTRHSTFDTPPTVTSAPDPAVIPRLGAVPEGERTAFRVWAPEAERVTLVLEEGDDGQAVCTHTLDPVAPPAADARGYFAGTAQAPPGARYRLQMDDGPRFPDPASRHQPDGVHGPSAVVDPTAYAWQHDAPGHALADLVIYELHVGAFTPEGTFDAARARLPHLADLGVTAVELMPVGDFPGRWNWGYDPAALYAPSRAYGPPDALRAFVDAAHGHGLAVVLDVIHNHLGPDGAYVAAFAPMLTHRYATPWGPAINLDGDGSAGVRRLFLDNVRHWLDEYRFDGLRLDATLSLRDASTTHFLRELGAFVHRLHETIGGPRRLVIAEDLRNVAHLARPRAAGGFGLDAVWSDDLHHQLRALLADDDPMPYPAYADAAAPQIAVTARRGWAHDDRKISDDDPAAARFHGSVEDLRPEQVVTYLENHDRVGNRPGNGRLHADVPMPLVRAATALLLTLPHTPLLFMGQEWAASAPFTFFCDFSGDLAASVREGRRRDVAHHHGPNVEVADPQAEATFRMCTLNWAEREAAPHAGMLRLHRDLLALRRDHLAATDRADIDAKAHGDHALVLRRGAYVVAVALAPGASLPWPSGIEVLLCTEAARYAEEAEPPVFEAACVRFPAGGAVIGVA
jgi:maltooligosyltrehalose trehalohydrolase